MRSSSSPFSSFMFVQTFISLEIALQWRIDPAFNDVGPFKFTVEVSEAPDFSVVLYTIPASNSFYCVDNTHQRQSSAVNLYYRVKLLTGADKEYFSAPLIYSTQVEKRGAFLKAKEIIRKEFVRFRYTGQRGWLLKRKNYGERDPANLDPITSVPLGDNGPDLGTGYTGGYYAPLRVTYSREGVENTVQLNEQGFGTTTQEVQKHRYVGFPHLEPYDVLVTDNNQRLRYNKVNLVLMPGTSLLLIQTCEAQLLPPTDPIYSIPI